MRDQLGERAPRHLGLAREVSRQLTLPRGVTIREVGPRDGLQAEAPLPPEARARLIDALSRTGVRRIEAVSFVSPKAVPAMAHPAEVWARVHRAQGVEYSALVPNRRGAEDALEAGGFGSLQAFLAASDGYNLHNVGKPVRASVEDVRQIVAVAHGEGVPVECSISSAFGDAYQGDVAPDRVLEVARWVLDAGADSISLADTTGMATPKRVWAVVSLVGERLPRIRMSLHFHDTRGTGLANVLAALQLGVTDLDSSVGGLGGSPFAPSGANGNVATEDLVHMLTDMDVETGIDLDRVLEAARLAESLVGHPLASQVSKSGPRWARGGHEPQAD